LANTYTFDFFNYAGIHRTVHLILQPATNIRDLTVRTTKLVRVGEDLGHGLGKNQKISELLNIFFLALLEFEIDMELGSQWVSRPLQCLVVVQDCDAQTKAATQVDAVQTTCKGRLEVRAAKLWWPIGSRPQPGYRHTVRVGLYDQNLTLVDSYDLKFGIRTVTWDNDRLFVNQEPFYLKGIGRHEDSDVISFNFFGSSRSELLLNGL
jgi:beta-glucuronidase